MRPLPSLASVALFVALGTNTLVTTQADNRLELYDVEPDAVKVKVYIYEDAVLNHADLIDCHIAEQHVAPWQDERFDVAQNMAEIWMHKALLIHPWRVLDPEEADVFYVPIYPVLSFIHKRCGLLSHARRMSAAVEFLNHKSPYFKRFGGTDHLFVCTWWNCRKAFGRWHRMVLRRAVLGSNDIEDWWAEWGCLGRNATIPYVASSSITTSSAIGGLHPTDRTIPFFFVGTSRGRPERQHLSVVKTISPESIIELGNNQFVWAEDGESYGKHMVRSRFCFCPRGDSLTSRRIFDAIAAGCIPVVTTEELQVLPYQGTGLDYSEFAVIAPGGTFTNDDALTALVQDLASRSDEDLEPLRKGLQLAMDNIIFGVSEGHQWGEMHPFKGAATRLLMEARKLAVTNRWDCPPLEFETRPDNQKFVHMQESVAPRTMEELPPPEATRAQWLSETETLVMKEDSLLFCAPRNTGSLQYRMLAKRMTGSENWAASDNRALLFDPLSSELPLLDVRNATLMTDIYKTNYNKWIKIGVVRDPVTRLLSLYFDNVQSSERRGHRLLEEGQDSPHLEDVVPGERANMEADITKATSFAAFVGTLSNDITAASAAFQPVSSLCGMMHSPFDAVIPFETLEMSSVQVLKSLPGGIWDAYGASGWGPDGTKSFMEFDYGAMRRQNPDHPSTGTNPDPAQPSVPSALSSVPRRARDLFGGDSCEWTKYYADEATLWNVHAAYIKDYDMFGWYRIEDWVARLRKCKSGGR